MENLFGFKLLTQTEFSKGSSDLEDKLSSDSALTSKVGVEPELKTDSALTSKVGGEFL